MTMLLLHSEDRTKVKVKMKWYLVASLLTVLTSSQGILTTLSQSNGKYKNDYATFLAEVFKLIVSSVLLWRDCKKSPPPKMTTDWYTVGLFPIPSVIYLIHNNVQFATLMYVDTSTYQIMGNLKIVTAGILFRLFLKKQLTDLQWMAIMLLAVGTTMSQVLRMSKFGAIFNMARLVFNDFRGGFKKGPLRQWLFNGYSITTWMVVLNLGSTGFWVSWLMKYADNIVKLFFGIIVCMMSLRMYFGPPSMLVGLPSTVRSDPESLVNVPVDRKTDS